MLEYCSANHLQSLVQYYHNELAIYVGSDEPYTALHYEGYRTMTFYDEALYYVKKGIVYRYANGRTKVVTLATQVIALALRSRYLILLDNTCRQWYLSPGSGILQISRKISPLSNFKYHWNPQYLSTNFRLPSFPRPVIALVYLLAPKLYVVTDERKVYRVKGSKYKEIIFPEPILRLSGLQLRNEVGELQWTPSEEQEQVGLIAQGKSGAVYGMGCNNEGRLMNGSRGWLATPLPIGSRVQVKPVRWWQRTPRTPNLVQVA